MFSQSRAAVVLFVIFTVLTGVVYPAVVTLIAQTCFHRTANGSVIEVGDKAVGSDLIGQPFASPHYFWSRPSATSPFPYNSASSSGSNLGPTNDLLVTAVGDRVKKLRELDPKQDDRPVPVDLVTSSASGLDPEISPAAAEYQIPRIAKARNRKPEEVAKLVTMTTESRWLGMLGEPRVNVLRLNLALDREFGSVKTEPKTEPAVPTNATP